MRVLLSGRPGVGKTTLIKRLWERVPACGFYTEEIRVGGRRIGFDGVNPRTGERVPLARLGSDPPRVGRYSVSVEGVERMIGWLKSCSDIIFVDEIGPMEMKHPEFPVVVRERALGSKVFIGTVHRSMAGRWAENLGAEIVWLTERNREKVFKELLTLLTSLSL